MKESFTYDEVLKHRWLFGDRDRDYVLKSNGYFRDRLYRSFKKLKPGVLVKINGVHSSGFSSMWIICVPYRYLADEVRLKVVVASFDSDYLLKISYNSLDVYRFESLGISDLPRYLNAPYRSRLFDRILKEGRV